MPSIEIRGGNIVYEILGTSGPFVVISPGGRRGMESDRALGNLLVEAGYQVIIYDRRNTGASDINFTGEGEAIEQARDLAALIKALCGGPIYVCGCSSGSRLSLLLALHHPEAVKALLLWRITGGPYPAQRLAFNYYEQFIQAAEKGGIDAVCQTEHFAALCRANPRNRTILDAMGRDGFIAALTKWLESFKLDRDHPVAGISPAQMRSLTLPALLVPGNDRIHPRPPALAAHRLMPNSQYREVLTHELDVDVDFEGWEAATGRLASVFIDFLRQQQRAG